MRRRHSSQSPDSHLSSTRTWHRFYFTKGYISIVTLLNINRTSCVSKCSTREGGSRDAKLDIILHSSIPTLLGSASDPPRLARHHGAAALHFKEFLSPLLCGAISVFFHLPLYHFPLECISVLLLHTMILPEPAN